MRIARPPQRNPKRLRVRDGELPHRDSRGHFVQGGIPSTTRCKQFGIASIRSRRRSRRAERFGPRGLRLGKRWEGRARDCGCKKESRGSHSLGAYETDIQVASFAR